MRTQTRLLRSFLAAYIALTILAGATSYHLLHLFQRQQAEDSARSLASVLTAGGFTFSERIQRRMEELTGFEFVVLSEGEERALHPPPGMVSAGFPGGVLLIDYQTDRYHAALRTVLVITSLVAGLGIAIFALVAWRISRAMALPLERLAKAATAIGAGDWQTPVPLVGHGEIRHLAEDLETMRRQLIDLDRRNRDAERLATLGTFTATIAHEVRNPLSAIQLTVQMLRQDPQAPPSLAMIEEEIERLDDTVDELLGFTRGMQVEIQPVELAEVVARVCQLLRRQASHAGVTLSAQGTARLQADPKRMRQLLLNLILNAIQALHGYQGDETGRVDIAILPDGLRVSDNGPGVDPAIRDELFSAFSSTRTGGTGLGLHLAALIARQHGASLSYEERPGGGSCFILRGLKPA
ncbi:MAG: sensor histidine kinase [Planctomycetota bacterium]|nr:MAG: sensor histidine kinase [Planctomycetota bacterium]